MREIILEQLNKYPGGIDAIHIQTLIEQRMKSGDDHRPRLPKLLSIVEELERMKDEGLADRLDGVPGAKHLSTRIYAKPGTYPVEDKP